MFVDENNNQISGLARIPGRVSTPADFRASDARAESVANGLTPKEFRDAQSMAGRCGNLLRRPENMPGPAYRTAAQKVGWYEGRLPILLRCLRVEHSAYYSQSCKNARRDSCLLYTVFQMFEEYRRVKRQAESEARQAGAQEAADGEMLARLLGQAVQNERERARAGRALVKTASTRLPGMTSYQAGKSAVSILDTVDPLARFRKQARTGTTVTPDIMPMPSLPGVTPQGRSSDRNDASPFRSLVTKRPKTKFKSVTPPVLNLTPQGGNVFDDLRLGRGLTPGTRNLVPPGGQSEPRGRQDHSLVVEGETPADTPGSSFGIDCRDFDRSQIPAYIAQCRISLEGSNAMETSMLPPEQQPCNVLMACGGQGGRPSDNVINAIIGCAEDSTFDSPACDLLETVLNQEYAGPQASMPPDDSGQPNMSLPPDDGPPNMSIPPDDGGQPPVVVVPQPGEPGDQGQQPPGMVASPTKEKDDKTMLYVGLGAAALVAVYLITQRRK